MIPIENKDGWTGEYFPLGTPADESDRSWAYRGLHHLVANDPHFLQTYFNFWVKALTSYGIRDTTTP